MDQAQTLREMVREIKGQEVTEAKSLSSKARVLAVTSGKGGVGKSNITYNLGLALAQLGKKVLLFDADLGLANLDLLIGVSPIYNLEHVLNGNKSLEQIIEKAGSEKLFLIPGKCGAKGLAQVTEKEKSKLLKSLNEISRTMDFIIIDTGAGISKNVLTFVLAAEEVIVVATPEPTSILDAYSMIKIIGQDMANGEISINLILNMVQDSREGERIASAIISLTKKHMNLDIFYLGDVIKDPNLIKAVKLQKPFLTTFFNSPAAQCFRKISYKVANVPDERKDALVPQDFFNRVARLFTR